jgi:hypothetical protein
MHFELYIDFSLHVEENLFKIIHLEKHSFKLQKELQITKRLK